MPQRKSKGCFVVRNSGRIEYKFFYENEYGQRKRKSISGGSKGECLQRAEMWLHKYKESIKPLDQTSSITDILRQKIESDYRANLIGESSLRSKTTNLKIIENNYIGTIPIIMVGINDIDAFGISVKHYSNAVIEILYQYLKTAFAIAEEEAIIAYNPMKSKRIRRPKSDRGDKKVKAFTKEEQDRLIDTMIKTEPPYGCNDFRLQLFIEMYSGMRMGEINALKPDDIDFEEGVIHVRSIISTGLDGKPFVKEGGKTQNSIRDVPISRTLEPFLREAVSRQLLNKQTLLFCDRHTGQPFYTSQSNSCFRTICRKANVEPRGQHALRHTFATRCIEAGVQPVVLKKWLGHSDIHITIDTYTDVLKEMNNDAIGMLNEYMITLGM